MRPKPGDEIIFITDSLIARTRYPRGSSKLIADACGLSHKQLIFEVTEHEEIAEKALLAKNMQAYAHSLFASSIDDFGAGYAGISLPLQFQPNIQACPRPS